MAPDGISVDDFAVKWVDDYPRPEASTNVHNRERITKFVTDFHGRLLNDVTRLEASQWAAENQWRVDSVRAMFNDAVHEGLLASNPFAGLRLPVAREGRVVLTESEVLQLVEIAFEKYPGWPVMSAMIEVAAYTGLRVGELFALRWEDINSQDATIVVSRQWRQKDKAYTKPKHQLVRTIALLEPAAAALRQLDPSRAPGGLVFYTQRGKPMTPRLLHYYWSAVRTSFRASLSDERRNELGPDFDFARLRHFAGSWLANHSATPQDIALQLGHLDGGTTAYKAYFPDGDGQRSVERLQVVGRGKKPA